MKFTAAFLALVAQSYALESLSQDVEDIPSCAHAALASAMTKEGCKITDISSETFDCMCRHMTPIVVDMVHAVSTDCSTEFASAIGHVCGVWRSNGYLSTTASDLPQATSILAKELGAVATDTAASGSPTATTSKAAAASAVVRPAVQYLGAAIAAVVVL
ncbi:Extracellular membrane protein- CFEM domain protein [Apiospora kogelbergensis]|uniref:Extracellular membrane protein- CFEM domain protein n=1 Tax=Apiospora kogelbergensis TaxID=1337665 RepID=UPI00312D0AA4